MRHYYIPLSSKDFTFESIFASESISPHIFYPQRGFGFDYSYKIPKIHHEKALILFTKIPKYVIPNESDDSVKFILQLDETCISQDDVILINEDSVGYQKTIYLNKNNFKILFFSERDKKFVLLKSETSLPTKGIKKYDSNFEVVNSEIGEQVDTKSIEKLKIDTDTVKSEIIKDRAFNSFKGFVYALVAGVLTENSKEEIGLKKALQEIVNCFAELKNKVSNNRIDESGYKGIISPIKSLEVVIKRLNASILSSEQLLNTIFPDQQISELAIAELIVKKSPKRCKDLAGAISYINHKILDDEILGTNNWNKLVAYYNAHAHNKSPIFYLEMLKDQVNNYIGSLKSNSNWAKATRDEINDRIKLIFYDISKYLESETIKKSLNKKIDIEGVSFSLEDSTVKLPNEFMSLNSNSYNEFLQISDCIFRHSKFGKGETSKVALLSLIEDVENVFTKNSKKSTLYRYINNEVNSYSIDNVSSDAMKNFIAFIFNPDSFERLENYVETKLLDHQWMAYAFWGAYNGFANLSRNCVKAIFETNNYFMQNYLDSYMLRYQVALANGSNDIELKVNTVKISNGNNKKVDERLAKNKEFYNKHLAIEYKLSFEDFISILNISNKDEMLQKLKEKKISNRAGKKILDLYTEFMSSGVLF